MRRNKRMFGLGVVFEADPALASGANSPAAGGGGDPPKAGGGGGQSTPAPNGYELTINGEKRTVTLAEMTDLAQKSAGADAKFREASEMRRTNEDAIRQNELIKRLSDPGHKPTETEIKELATQLDVDPNEFAEYINSNDNDGNADNKSSKKSGIDLNALDEATAQAIVQKGLGISPAEARQVLDYSRLRHIEDARQKIREFSDSMVDKDEIFGKMIVGEKKADRESVVKDMVAEDVLRRIQDGGQFGTELVVASIQKVRTHLQKFGTPGRPDQYPLTMGLGPSSGLPAEVMSEKPIDRKSAAEDGDDGNFIGRWMQKYLMAKRAQG